MADILKTYTAEQLYNMYQGVILSDNVGLTDFNRGTKNKALLESNSEIISSISIDFKQGIYNAIPIALYQGFGFARKAASTSIGYLKPYRKPEFYIKYTGVGTSALITSTDAIMSSTVTGAPSDAFSFDYATYDTVDLLVAEIDALTNWEATLVKNSATSSLYQYTDKEVIGSTNYLYAEGLDITNDSAIEVSIPIGFSVSVNQQTFITTLAGTISAGETGAQIIAASTLAGTDGNIIVNAIDTLNGKGYINSSIPGIEQVINDASFSGGAAQETSNDRKVRFKETVNALNAGTKSGIIATIKGVSGVRSAGMRTAFPFKGTNTIIVDDGTGTISATLQAAVEKVLYGDANDTDNYPGKNAEGIGYNIVAPTIIPIDIGMSVTRLSNVNVDLTVIKNDVQSAIEQYINTRALGQNVLTSELIRNAKNSNSAAYDVVLTSPSSNIVINDDEFAKTGAGTGGTVTVVVSIAGSE